MTGRGGGRRGGRRSARRGGRRGRRRGRAAAGDRRRWGRRDVARGSGPARMNEMGPPQRRSMTTSASAGWKARTRASRRAKTARASFVSARVSRTSLPGGKTRPDPKTRRPSAIVRPRCRAGRRCRTGAEPDRSARRLVDRSGRERERQRRAEIDAERDQRRRYAFVAITMRAASTSPRVVCSRRRAPSSTRSTR